jgi:hypothetical protein
VHVAAAVAAVRALWDRSGALAGPHIREQLTAFAGAVSAGHGERDPAAEVLVGNWLHAPRWQAERGSAAERTPFTGSVSSAQAQLIAARDHGFSSWTEVSGECDPGFERAVDAVVLGQAAELDRLLADAPELAHRRSAYGHRATLLHYTAANGVEIRRQVVPANAAEIAARLLEAGADPAARLRAYGGTPDTLAMLRSSAHPQAAGVAAELERMLLTARS